MTARQISTNCFVVYNLPATSEIKKIEFPINIFNRCVREIKYKYELKEKFIFIFLAHNNLPNLGRGMFELCKNTKHIYTSCLLPNPCHFGRKIWFANFVVNVQTGKIVPRTPHQKPAQVEILNKYIEFPYCCGFQLTPDPVHSIFQLDTKYAFISTKNRNKQGFEKIKVGPFYVYQNQQYYNKFKDRVE